MTGSQRFRMIVLGVLVATAAMYAQESAPWVETIPSALRSMTVNGSAGTFLAKGGYGMIATAGVGFPIPLTSPLAEGNFFGRDADVELSIGSGFWSRANDLSASLSIETAELGVNVPIFTPADYVDLAIRPSVALPVMSDHLSGSRDWVPTGSLGMQLDLSVLPWLQVRTEYRWSWMQTRSFLWANDNQTLNVGLCVQLGEAFADARQQVHDAEALRVALSRTQDSLAIHREMMSDVVRRLEGISVSAEMMKSLNALEREVKDLKTDFRTRRASESLAAIRELPAETPPRLQTPRYDKTRMARVQTFAVTRPLFSRGDLVDEDYLKSVLATLNTYDGYVWAIAYRDSGSAGPNDGSKLAEKLWGFFKIYNSSFDRRMCLIHDPAMAHEFEFRCLGLSLD